MPWPLAPSRSSLTWPLSVRTTVMETKPEVSMVSILGMSLNLFFVGLGFKLLDQQRPIGTQPFHAFDACAWFYI